MSTTRYKPAAPGRSRDAERLWTELFHEPDGRKDRLVRNLRRAMDRELTPRQKQMLELYYGRQLSIPAISRLLGVAPSTVSRTLRRARDRLRRYLEYSF